MSRLDEIKKNHDIIDDILISKKNADELRGLLVTAHHDRIDLLSLVDDLAGALDGYMHQKPNKLDAGRRARAALKRVEE